MTCHELRAVAGVVVFTAAVLAFWFWGWQTDCYEPPRDKSNPVWCRR